jgi:hypothetical protein
MAKIERDSMAGTYLKPDDVRLPLFTLFDFKVL